MIARAVTGLGIVSALGVGREAFVRAMAEPPGDGGTAVASFDATKYPGARAFEVPSFEPSKYLGDKGLRTLDRLTKLLIVAARLAMHDAGYKKDGAYVQSSPERCGLVCSNAYGSLEAITELDRVATLEDARYINPAKFPNTVSNSASGYAAIWEDLRAINVTVSDGNCGGLDAVACADIYLETGRADVLLVGGAEAMSEALFVAFQRLGVLEPADGETTTAIGEGAALMVTEPASAARARGARILGEIAGYGTAFMAPDQDGPRLLHASSDAMERAIRGALSDAGASPGDVDVVASGVSGLRSFDQAELSAIARVLGEGRAVAAPKRRLGETLGAGGAMAMATSLAWLAGAAPAPLLRGAAPREVRTVLATSMGYYGNASAVLLRASAQ